ncbi:hypothetical protein, partial [Aeromonas media]|uniref:hypothetical protein n=1 Tax=Aeromonas media TaxID=651 RepID=UPI0038D08321
RLKSVKAILTIKLTAYHRPISICFVGKKLFLIFNKMFTISPCAHPYVLRNGLQCAAQVTEGSLDPHIEGTAMYRFKCRIANHYPAA